MCQFVDHHMRHQLADRDIAALGPFIQDRAAKQPDQVGVGGLVSDRFFGHRNAFV